MTTMRAPRWPALPSLLLAVAVLLAACADDNPAGDGTSATSPDPAVSDPMPGDASPSPGTGDPAPAPTGPQPTYAWIQANVFDASCTGCHSGPGARQGLSLAAADVPSIVGKASSEQPGVLLITAGNADASYLIRKVEGTAGISGARMPYGGPYLDAGTLKAMRDWVTAGAAIP